MTVVAVDSQEFQAAATGCYRANQAAVGAVSSLAGALSGCGGMAGSDSSGQSWAHSYDPAAQSLLGLATDLANALGVAGDLLSRTAANHAAADAASTAGTSYGSQAVPTGGSAATLRPANPPSAYGGPSVPPFGWSLIAHLIAYAWPNGQQDQLRQAGQAWRTAGSAMTAQDGELSSAIAAITAQRTPEASAAATQCQQLQAGLTDLGDAAAGLAAACEQYAGYLDQAHQDVIAELVSLAEWSVVIEATGVVLTAFTAGISDAAAQGAVAARCAAAAARISGILGQLLEVAGELAQSIVNLAARVIELADKVKVFLASQVSKATTAVVARLPGAARAAKAGDEVTAALEYTSSRARELQNMLPEASRGRVTMASGVGRDAEGNLRHVVGTSERGGYLRKGVELTGDEDVAVGSGHAEANIDEYMRDNGIQPIAVGAGRPVCPACAATLEKSGSLISTPLKVVRTKVIDMGGSP